jgi:hypothetical protein
MYLTLSQVEITEITLRNFKEFSGIQGNFKEISGIQGNFKEF